MHAQKVSSRHSRAAGHELTAVMAACTIPVPAQTRSTLNMERGDRCEFRPPARKLLTAVSFWKRDSQFALRVATGGSTRSWWEAAHPWIYG